MTQQYKLDKANKLKEKFDNSKNYIFTNYSGLSVEKITELRSELRKLDTQYSVIKNNYSKRILKEKELPEMGDSLIGPTAIAFVDDEVNAVLKVLFKFAKKSTLEIKGGFAEDSVFDHAGLEALSKLPGKEQLIAMLMSTMNAPLQNFVFACNDVMGRFVRVLSAVAESKK